MRLLPFVLLLIMAAVAPAPADAARKTKPCGFVSFEEDPNTPNDNGGHVAAGGMSCAAARREVRRWVLTDRDGEARGWNCTTRRSTSSQKPPVNRTTCTKGRRTIKLTVWEL